MFDAQFFQESKVDIQILAINGSMRRKAKTNYLIEVALASAKKIRPKLKTKIIQIADLNIKSCHSCYDACSKIAFKCATKNDDFQAVFDELKGSDAILIGAPLYFMIPSRLNAIIERLSCLAYFNEVRGHKAKTPLEDKPCGFIAVCALDSPMPVLEHLHKLAIFMRMKTVTINKFPFLGVAGRADLKQDTTYHPIENAKVLGRQLVKTI